MVSEKLKRSVQCSIFSLAMNKIFKTLLTALFTCLSLRVQCHELLSDFLEFQDQNTQIALSKICADHLSVIKQGIENKKVWALKGNSWPAMDFRFMMEGFQNKFSGGYSSRCKWKVHAAGLYVGQQFLARS